VRRRSHRFGGQAVQWLLRIAHAEGFATGLLANVAATFAFSEGSSGTDAVHENVCAVLLAIAEAVRDTIRTGHTSTGSPIAGVKPGPVPPKREM
jgi:hypothetical protein